MIWTVERKTVLEDASDVGNEFLGVIISRVSRIWVWLDGVRRSELSFNSRKVHGLLDDLGVMRDIKSKRVDRELEWPCVLEFLQSANSRSGKLMLMDAESRHAWCSVDRSDDRSVVAGERGRGRHWGRSGRSLREDDGTREAEGMQQCTISTPARGRTTMGVRVIVLTCADAMSASDDLRARFAGGGCASSSSFMGKSCALSTAVGDEPFGIDAGVVPLPLPLTWPLGGAGSSSMGVSCDS